MVRWNRRRSILVLDRSASTYGKEGRPGKPGELYSLLGHCRSTNYWRNVVAAQDKGAQRLGDMTLAELMAGANKGE
jgi:hypothetical protein